MEEVRSQNLSCAPFSQVPPLQFETERLTLRAARLEDVDLIFAVYAGDMQATRYMAWPRQLSPADGLDFIGKVVDSFASHPNGDASYIWLIGRKEDGRCIGSCGVGRSGDDSVSGGYILSPEFWGQGYASEAWKTLVEWVKTQPNVRRLWANHHPDNPASGQVMKKSGMEFKGIDPQSSDLPQLGPGKFDMVVWEWIRRGDRPTGA